MKQRIYRFCSISPRTICKRFHITCIFCNILRDILCKRLQQSEAGAHNRPRRIGRGRRAGRANCAVDPADGSVQPPKIPGRGRQLLQVDQRVAQAGERLKGEGVQLAGLR